MTNVPQPLNRNQTNNMSTSVVLNPIDEAVKRAKAAAVEASRFSRDAQEAVQLSNQRASHYAAIAASAAANAVSHASSAVKLAVNAPVKALKISEVADKAEANRDEARYAALAAAGRFSDIMVSIKEPEIVEVEDESHLYERSPCSFSALTRIVRKLTNKRL